MIAEIIIIDAKYSFDIPYHYHIPDHLSKDISPGMRVLLPFGNGNKLEEGLVIKLLEGEKTKELKEIFGPLPMKYGVGKEALVLMEELSSYYATTQGAIAKAILPSSYGIEKAYSYHAKKALKREEKEILSALQRGEKIPDKVVSELLAEDLISREITYVAKGQHLKKRFVVAAATDEEIRAYQESLPSNASKMKAYLEDLMKHPSRERMHRSVEISKKALDKFVEAGVVRLEERVLHRNSLYKPRLEKKPFYDLRPGQKKAFDQVQETFGRYQRFLLQGITGSGKTEVYLHLTKAALEAGHQVIILVPEISLVPQTAERFIERFGDIVGTFHSKMSSGEKLDEYVRMRSGEISIVVGARSAVFAPFDNIGLIVVDEEHEGSYKSDQDPRYDARYVASLRGQYHHCPVLYGSATPSVDQYEEVLTGNMIRLRLDHRATGALLPPVEIVDMREELKEGHKSLFSRPLLEAIDDRLRRKEQTILFLNKKGHSSHVSCRACGYVMKCKACDISMTYHAYMKKTLCKYCGYEEPVPSTCPSCGSPYFKFFGAGTERVEGLLKDTFPTANILRMDGQSMMRKNALKEAYEGIRAGAYDIILGTQIIAKGFDIENITLVGVLAADLTINLPMYTAGERAFQLITQVAGRSGRGRKEGQVIVQSYEPDNYALLNAAKHDYDSFVRAELEIRRSFAYPPFVKLVLITVSSEEERQAIKVSHLIADRLKDLGLVVKGSVPAMLSKIRRRYRYQVMIKLDKEDYQEDKDKIIKTCYESVTNNERKHVKIGIDIDPNSLL